MKKFLVVFGVSVIVFACNSSDDAKPAEEKKPDTVAAAPTVQNEKGLELIGASDCTTCHLIDKKNIGPAYTDVAQKYENTEAVIDTLIGKVINGGAGNWGDVAMTPHPQLPKEDVREMIKYILSLKK